MRIHVMTLISRDSSVESQWFSFVNVGCLKRSFYHFYTFVADQEKNFSKGSILEKHLF